MIIEESFSLAASPTDVASFFLDVDRMSRCVPGVDSVRAIDPDRYEATMSIRLGPIQARFAGNVRVDSTDAPHRLAASARGNDKATGSQAEVEFTANLVELADGTTRVDSISDVTIRGRLGQFGTGVITSTAKAMVREFATCAGTALATSDAPAAQPMQPTGLGRAISQGIGIYLKTVLQRAGAFFKRLVRRGDDEGQ
jgi:carbon monoxide dehydrogenase subunit G